MTNLIDTYPLAARFIRRLREIDPFYGNQQHQRAFVARLHRMQELQPCGKDHEHNFRCYSKEVVDQARVDTAGVL